MKTAPKILVVGSFVMDQVAMTSTFPREGQTVIGQAFHKAAGGKGANQAVQAARLGANVSMVGKLGDDANGISLLNACTEAGVNTDHVIVSEGRVSGCAVIILEKRPDRSTQNRIIVIPGTNMEITPEDVAFLRNRICDYDLVLLQLEIPMEINELVAALAHEQGVPVMLNPAPSAPLSDALLQNISYLSPNEHEAEDLTGIHIAHTSTGVDWEAVYAAGNALRQRGANNVLITLGSAGSALITRDGMHRFSSAPNVSVVDPTAAGDSFVAAFCTGVCMGLAEKDAMQFATCTAALTIGGMGAMPSLPTRKQVEYYIESTR